MLSPGRASYEKHRSGAGALRPWGWAVRVVGRSPISGLRYQVDLQNRRLLLDLHLFPLAGGQFESCVRPVPRRHIPARPGGGGRPWRLAVVRYIGPDGRVKLHHISYESMRRIRRAERAAARAAA